MPDLLFKNGTIVHHDGQRRENILVRGEKIIAVGPDITNSQAEQIDCSNRLIFPGIIDPHTHMGIPIKDGWSADDFNSGSQAALHGGVTTIIDFSILGTEQSLIDSINQRLEQAAGSHCDYSLHCNITRFDEKLLEEIPALIENGISSFKVFTTYEEADMMLTYDQIEIIAGILAAHGGLLMVHAEDNAVISAAMQPLVAESHNQPQLHGLSRPAVAEEQAIRKIAAIIHTTGCPGYIVHLSSQAGLAACLETPELILETCPQYLLLNQEYYERPDGRMYVASPPLRANSDNQALWEALQQSSIHTLGTDHCPFNLADKVTDIPFHQIPNGIGGVETLFPVMLAQFIEREIDLSLLTRLTSSNPAVIFGLQHRKGFIRIDADADMVIVDPKNVSTDWKDQLVQGTDWNAYTEFPAIFPQQVFLRGQQVVRNGSIASLVDGSFIQNRFPEL